MDERRRMLRHFLAALAYRTQKALRDAPEDFGAFRAGEQVRSPHELIRHMDSVLGYARTYFIGGSYRPPDFAAFKDAVAHFHEVVEDLARHLETGTEMREITSEILLQGPFSDAMTHAGQLALLRRLAGSPVPPENFIFAAITVENLGPDQPLPVSPDAVWPEKPARAEKRNSIATTIEGVTASLFELYKIGVGPSSSHTMGPMRAAFCFARKLGMRSRLDRIARVQVDLYGSLALTGIGHATDRAILLGLAGNEPATIDPALIEATVAQIRSAQRIDLAGAHSIPFEESRDLLFHRDVLYPPGARTQHPNGLRLTAFDAGGAVLDERTFFSIGGGFIVEDAAAGAEAGLQSTQTSASEGQPVIPFPFHSAAELLATAQTHELSISQLMLENECALVDSRDGRARVEVVRAGIDRIWQTMCGCMERGMATEGILPGGLNVRRRAHRLAERLRANEVDGRGGDPLAPLDWVTVYAMAVNEENAAGGRVVTAPTNGAAGVVPAVVRYYERFIPDADHEGILRFFLTSAAIGILYKENASISGAEVGCQGEVGVACSMAAGGLTAALGGTNGQIEHAAEIAMEHNLGMTCDPIGGLVQIPCIERNAMGAVKAVHATRIAMNESEAHKVSLDQVIRTMYLTGLDMQSRYKETSLAGLALNVIEC